MRRGVQTRILHVLRRGGGEGRGGGGQDVGTGRCGRARCWDAGGAQRGVPPPLPTSPTPHPGNPPPRRLIPGGAQRAPRGALRPPGPSQGHYGVGGLSARHGAQCPPPAPPHPVPACLCHRVSPPRAVTCREGGCGWGHGGRGDGGTPRTEGPRHGLTWHLRPPRVGGARGCGQSRRVPWGGTWGQGGVMGRGDRRC